MEGAERAILYIHGIVGTPNHFAEFIKLVPGDVSVYNMLLDGHGKTAADFGKTTMKKWEAQVEAAVAELLAQHNELFIVAHSMGTLFAIEQAVNNDRISGLFLMAVPIKLFIKPRMLSNAMKVYFDRIRPDDTIALAAKACYGIHPDKNPVKYFGWLPRYLELFSKIRKTRKILPALKTKCVAYQSVCDEMVSKKSISYLNKNSCMDVIELKNSTHYYYEKADFAFLLSEFKKFMQ
ncbi:MAG: alpha/beta fold hydrolase [Oscillospiraceae bacterium]|nr:alpha/beta fold hydrolase [Oscillospiraceae bacterium]